MVKNKVNRNAIKAKEEKKAKEAENTNRSDWELAKKYEEQIEKQKERLRRTIYCRANGTSQGAAIRAEKYGEDFNASLRAAAPDRTNSRIRYAEKVARAATTRHNIKYSPTPSAVVKVNDKIKYIRTLLDMYSVQDVLVDESTFNQINKDVPEYGEGKGKWKYRKSYQLRRGHRIISKELLMLEFAVMTGIRVDELGILVNEEDFDRVLTLYHGTPHSNIEAILNDNLLRPGSIYCLFGSGIYTTPDIAKAWNYTGMGWQLGAETALSVKYIIEVRLRPGPIAVGNDSIKRAIQHMSNKPRRNGDILSDYGYMSIYVGPDVKAYSHFHYSEYVCYKPDQVELSMIHEFARNE